VVGPPPGGPFGVDDFSGAHRDVSHDPYAVECSAGDSLNAPDFRYADNIRDARNIYARHDAKANSQMSSVLRL
jgi:hypothetical protein